jgi:hypothetical protein
MKRFAPSSSQLLTGMLNAAWSRSAQSHIEFRETAVHSACSRRRRQRSLLHPLSQSQYAKMAISPEVRSVSAVVEIGLRATVRYPGL